MNHLSNADDFEKTNSSISLMKIIDIEKWLIEKIISLEMKNIRLEDATNISIKWYDVGMNTKDLQQQLVHVCRISKNWKKIHSPLVFASFW